MTSRTPKTSPAATQRAVPAAGRGKAALTPGARLPSAQAATSPPGSELASGLPRSQEGPDVPEGGAVSRGEAAPSRSRSPGISGRGGASGGGGAAALTSGYVVELPPGLKMLSLNGRLHWAQQRRVAAEIRKAAWAVALRDKIPHLDGVEVTVVYHPPDRRRRDCDNIGTISAKHAIDGCVAAGVLEDDAPPHITSIRYEVGEIVKGGQLVLHLAERVSTR